MIFIGDDIRCGTIRDVIANSTIYTVSSFLAVIIHLQIIMIDPTNDWPAWPEFTKETGENDPDNVRIKKEILTKYGEAAIRQSWTKVCQNLALRTEEIAKRQSSIIQEIEYTALSTLSEEKKAELKQTGCFVIRNVIPKSTANEWFQQLQTYVADNEDTITGECNCGWRNF